MKKFLRLVSVCLIPGLLLVFINVALAGSPVSKSRASEFAGQTSLNSWAGRPANRSLLQVEPITGLSITHSLPAFANFQMHFTATTTSGTSPIFYTWSFGDGTLLPLDAGAVVSHTYATTGTYTVVVTTLNQLLSFVSQATSVTIEETPYRVHLPLIWKESGPLVEPSELVCDLSLDPPAPSAGQTFVLSVKIQNLQGGSADGFWVDLYINPTKLPSQNHLFPWPEACDPSSCPGGIAWGISDAPLAPGITRTLVSIPKNFHPNGYDPVYSSWTGSLPAGTYDLYAYADSIDKPVPDNISGAVPETDEDNNRCEILDLVIPAVNITGVDWHNSNPLPVRPTP